MFTAKHAKFFIVLLLIAGVAAWLGAQAQPQVGYAILAPDPGGNSPVGSALFSYTNSGVLVSEAGVGAAQPIGSGRIFVDEVGTQTAIALANPSDLAAKSTLVLRDAAGNESARVTLDLAPRQHTARFVSELFPNRPPNFTGSLTFDSTVPLAAITLRQSRNAAGEPVYATLPVVDQSQAGSTSTVVFPQIAAGDGYTTELILINSSSQTLRGRVTLTASNGQSLLARLAGIDVSDFAYQIDPQGTYRARLDSVRGLVVGYATLTPDPGTSAPAGSAIFQVSMNNKLVSEAGVGAIPETVAARIFVDYVGTQTGIAVANARTTDATLTITLMNRYGDQEAQTTRTLPAGNHLPIFVDQLFPSVTEGFTGILEVRSTVPFVPITLKLTTNSRGEMVLTTLPVADLMRPIAAAPAVFPQIAIGSGFSTRLILINAGSGSAANGGMTFYRSDATRMVIPMGGVQGSQFSYQLGPGSARQFRPGNTERLTNLILLDKSAKPTTELPVNEGNRVRPSLRFVDSARVVRDDFDAAYTSSNPDVAPVDGGFIVGRARGFSTLTMSAGGAVTAIVVTVIGNDSGDPGFTFSHVLEDPAQRLYLTATEQQMVLFAKSVKQVPGIYAGTPQKAGLKNDLRLQSQFNNPSFLASNDFDGSLYVSDSTNHVIRQIHPGASGRVETFAGIGTPGTADGSVSEAAFRNPQGIARDDRGGLWVADSDNHTIRRIDLITKRVETKAGSAGNADFADGKGSTARFHSPSGITVEPRLSARQPVSIIVADTGNGALRRVYEDGTVETLDVMAMAAGGKISRSAMRSIARDRVAPRLNFSNPVDVAADAFGTIYVTEPASKQVWAILPDGTRVPAAQANTFENPRGVIASRAGGIVVADTRPQQIRYGQPQITGITPGTVSVRGGAKITLRGKNFAPGTLLVIGDLVIPDETIAHVDTETMSFTAPPLPSGRATLTLQNRGGLSQIELRVDPIPLSELPVGYVTTIAGGSTFAGDGSTATAASISPARIAQDPAGNIFIADVYNHRIRRIDSRTRVITTVAGNGQYSFSGDGRLAITAALNTPLGIAVDTGGNLFIADSYNNRIRRVDAKTAIISTVAGTGTDGFSGDGSAAVNANLRLPEGLAIDALGNLLIADTNNHRIRKVDTAGIITTVAGDGIPRFFGDNGPARTASFYSPEGIYVDSHGNLWIADTGNHRIRRIDTDGIITTVAGTGEFGFSVDGTPALAAMLGSPKGVAIDADDNIIIADSGNYRVRKITRSNSSIMTIAGTGESRFYGDGGSALAAGVSLPSDVMVDAGGNVLIADFESRRLRRIDGTSGNITTIAGNGEGAFLGDNVPATTAVIDYPLALAFDAAGNLFVGDSDNRVRKIDMLTGLITIVAGGGNPTDGIGDRQSARESDIFAPSGLAFDRDGNLYIADTAHARIRKIDARTNIITTIAGTGVEGFSGDGGPASAAQLNSPRTLAIDRSGNLFIADEGNRRVRKIDKITEVITTVAGNGSRGSSGDQGLANLASLSPVQSIVLDSSDNLFIADYENEKVRRVDSSTQIITTVAGGGVLRGNGGGATDVDILPISLAFDGRLFIMELVRQAIVRIGVNNAIALVMGNGEAALSGDNGPATAASLSYPAAMAFDRFGNLFIADSNNNRIRAVRGPIP